MGGGLTDGLDLALGGKGKLDVYLCELGLPIATAALVAVTPGKLEVAVEPADHEQLLELLRRLHQTVELAGPAAGEKG